MVKFIWECACVYMSMCVEAILQALSTYFETASLPGLEFAE